MPNNSIDNFNFIRITPPPILPARQWQVEMRTGVDSVTLFDTGRRAPPWQLATLVDCLSLGEASLLYAAYRDCVNKGEAVTVTYAGMELPILYKPLEVTAERMHKIVGGIGGVNPSSTAILACRWVLQPIGPEPEPEPEP